MITKYIGKDKEVIKKIEDELIRRKQIKEIIKKLIVEQQEILKTEAIL